MNRIAFKKIILPILLIFSSANFSFAEFYVVGYFPNWTNTDPASLPFNMLTHINYAFVTPTAIGGLKGVTSKNDSTYLRTLVSSAHAYNVKVLISIGGFGGSGNFAPVAADPNLRTTFTNNVLNFVKVFNLDGADIDWEFPTNSQEAEGCYQLMKQLSDSLHNHNKLSTMAVNPYGVYADNIKSEIFDYVDFLTLMAYDGGTPHSNIGLANQAIDYWINGRELPKEKTVLGVPFYGRNTQGVVSYKNLVANDELAPYKDQTDYTYKNNSTIYNTNYNGIQTIKNKTNLALKNAGGIMIWELTNDTNDNTSLLRTIHSLVPTYIENTLDESAFSIHPNPTSDHFILNISEKFQHETIKISILDLAGKNLKEHEFTNSLSRTINTGSLNSGFYLLNIQIGEKSTQKKLVISQK